MAEEIVKRQLTIRSFHCDKVEFGDDYAFAKDGENYKLTIKKGLEEELKNSSELIDKVTVKILKPGEHDIQINNVIDVLPISVKALGKIGEGITHTITGAYVMITGVDTDDRQVCAFGSSNGLMSKMVVFDQPGTPAMSDYIILVDMVIKGGYATKRIGPDAIATATELMCNPIRDILVGYRDGDQTETNVYKDVVRPGKKKVAIVKLVSGQGAMYDTHYFSKHPSGFDESRSIIDSVGSPIILSANEYRDGALRCMYG